MNTSTELKARIMRRIYMIWFARTLWHSLALKLAGILALTVVLKQLVSLQSVIMNTLQLGSFAHMFSYLEYAFTHTHLSVQVTFLLMVLMAVWIIVDAFKKDFVMLRQMLALR